MESVKINKKKESGECLKAIEKADKEIIELLFIQLRGLAPEFKEKIKGLVYKCHMFEVEKFLATGEHDKSKARLVFDGREQDLTNGLFGIGSIQWDDSDRQDPRRNALLLFVESIVWLCPGK